MRIVTLVENETEDRKLQAAHGLSLYIETNGKKILFDVGPNGQIVKNAKRLGVSLADVDLLVVSHGHNDHGGGLNKFLKQNKKAEIYMARNAFDEFVKKEDVGMSNIGLKRPSSTSRITFIERPTEISPGIIVYAGVEYKRNTMSDRGLKIYNKGIYKEDDFEHEIYLVVMEENKNILFTGCAHNGIKNIVDTIERNLEITFSHVIGGFHFSKYDPFNFNQATFINEVAVSLAEGGKKKVYSCHCTGDDAYNELKQELKHNLSRLKTGSIVTI